LHDYIREGADMKGTIKIIGIIAAVAIMISIVPFVASSEAVTPAAAANNGMTDEIKNRPVAALDTEKTGGTGSIFLYVGSPVAYVDGVKTQIDPDNIEVTPVIIDGVEMVPVRFIAESLGGTVSWDQKTLTAAIELGNETYLFTQGSDVMISGKSRHPLGATVQAYKGRTFVPLDTFVEILGKKAFYDRGLIVISDKEDVFDPTEDKEIISGWILKLSYLPVVGSYDKLVSLLEEARQNEVYLIKGNDIALDMGSTAAVDNIIRDEPVSAEKATAGSNQKTLFSTEPESATKTKEGQDYSSTNVQVQGVDEGDIVKTDGSYIYHVNRERVVITKVDSPENMKVVSTLTFSDKNLHPLELYLHDNRMIVVGSSWANLPVQIMDEGVRREFYPAPYSSRSVKVFIYDMSDRSNLKLLREVELEGAYVSSRKVGSALYLIANGRLNYRRIKDDKLTPFYRDSKRGDNYIYVGYDSIRYFPSAIHNNYMFVAGVDVEGDEPANVSTYLGAGENIYASTENLYVAVSDYSKVHDGSASEEVTQLYKFAMKDAQLNYLCKGEVPGTVLNQFSMDEQGNYFRIATTRGDMWATGDRISKNALYVLDSMLSVTGRLDDIAPGEKIYSVRFMGDRAYMVTFRTVDPLFVIDLKDPAKPAVLGALKIPGYSDYLHPYDENHIIGFGKDTVEMKGQAYYLGMKVALFDVSDVSNPVQKFSEIIGDRGTESELLSNHKALLFSKEKNLLAFPVTLMEVRDSDEKAKLNSLQYGVFTFQGALVYRLDLENGFQLKGRITHLSDEDYKKAGDYWYDSDKNVQKIIYIGDNLFTISNRMIKANAINDLKEKGTVLLP